MHAGGGGQRPRLLTHKSRQNRGKIDTRWREKNTRELWETEAQAKTTTDPNKGKSSGTSPRKKTEELMKSGDKRVFNAGRLSGKM